ncbi:MAG: hypothetical protein AABW50_03355 [Nanoarchaeota archaeon]
MRDQEYKSVERKIADHLETGGEELKNFGSNYVRVLYGTIASTFRIPTLVRKLIMMQTPSSDVGFSHDSTFWGQVVGVIVGLGADYKIITDIADSTKDENYIPLAVLTGTNILSGMYELRRLSKSKEKNTSLEASINESD